MSKPTCGSALSLPLLSPLFSPAWKEGVFAAAQMTLFTTLSLQRFLTCLVIVFPRLRQLELRYCPLGKNQLQHTTFNNQDTKFRALLSTQGGSKRTPHKVKTTARVIKVAKACLSHAQRVNVSQLHQGKPKLPYLDLRSVVCLDEKEGEGCL